MAGDWIKVEHCTPDKPEIWEMADILGIDADAVFGKLIRVWMWADQNTIDGNANVTLPALLDRVTGVTNFGNAMLKVGWLQTENGKLTFPNFDRHNGKTAKTRALTAIRVARNRVTKMKRSCNDTSVSPSSLLLKTVRILIKENESVSERFENSWREWVDYRASIKKPMTEQTGRKLAAKLLQWGEDRAVAAIDHTIASGWQGLREPEPERNGRAGKKVLRPTLLDEGEDG